jgi:hypothetical protein
MSHSHLLHILAPVFGTLQEHEYKSPQFNNLHSLLEAEQIRATLKHLWNTFVTKTGFYGLLCVHFLTNPLQNRTKNMGISVTKLMQKNACHIPNPLLFVYFQRYCNIVDILLWQDSNNFDTIDIGTFLLHPQTSSCTKQGKFPNNCPTSFPHNPHVCYVIFSHSHYNIYMSFTLSSNVF